MSIVNLTTENFQTEVMEARVPVLIDFWASWCGPCKMMSPVVDEIAEEMGVNAKVCKVNIDEQSELAGKFNVMSIPTFIVIEDGKEIGRTIGVQDKEEIKKMLQ